ncbi:hypothetical protein [Maliponia aquimaris]|uniref:Uncharacterized protein n=1 Tax=Maliponia aquimaris TaxID=1673631 RepID=A0A238K031_9RHOB|nr:hypothetical protein [Maliponia aquimaris]SMX36259.1 hypothetical protein MAA8898_00805 [Maliponia aquimaris]
MPAVFNHVALMSLPVSSQGEVKPVRPVPPGQAQMGGTTSSGAAPFGAGAPLATGAVLRPTGQLPIPAPPPVVSTSQTGALVASALNGLNREPMPREREAPVVPVRPSLGARGDVPVPRGLPGGPAPAARGGTAGEAARGYRALR